MVDYDVELYILLEKLIRDDFQTVFGRVIFSSANQTCQMSHPTNSNFMIDILERNRFIGQRWTLADNSSTAE